MPEKHEIETEIVARIQSENKCFFGLAKLLGSRSLSIDLKILLYVKLIRPIITYRAETWSLRKIDERNFLFKRQNITKIFWTYKRHVKWGVENTKK